MVTTLDHPLVQDYLRRLHDETVRLRVDEGRELEAQIREHLVAALGVEATEADVREVLDRLGEPSVLVDEAGGATPPPGHGRQGDQGDQGDQGGQVREDGAWREIGALVGLVGATLLFWFPLVNVVLWLGGLVLLVIARRWGVADKLWGALVLGLAPWLAVAAGAMAYVTTGEVCQSDATGATTCTGGGADGLTALNIVAIVLTVAFALLYLWTLVRLARKAARPA